MTPRRVVALSYDPDSSPPQVVYKAVGLDAETLLQANRRRYGIKVVKNEDLARRLFRLPIQGEIGIELYGLVAQILVHVFEVEASVQSGQDTSVIRRA
jgi:type III secretion system FlhB-like substrate exporter